MTRRRVPSKTGKPQRPAPQRPVRPLGPAVKPLAPGAGPAAPVAGQAAPKPTGIAPAVGPLSPSVVPAPSAPSAPAPENPPAGPAPDMARIIEEACRFILERKRRHAAQIAWEVGEYLFERVYRGDLETIEYRDPRREDSLRDIGARTGIGRVRLQSWIRAYVARKYLAPEGIDADLSMSDFEALRPLVFFPKAARAILELRKRHRLTTQQLDALAVAWRRRLDEGGRLRDLVAATGAASAALGASRPRPGRPRPLGDRELAIVRLVRVVGRWLEAVRLAPSLRAAVLGEVRRLRGIVAGGSGGAPSPAEPGGIEAATATVVTEGPAGPAAAISAKAIDAAVSFIVGRLRGHGLQFALEVGEYLFREVYGGDRGLFRNGGRPWQRESIQKIARDPRVRLDDSFLYRAIHAYLLVGQASAALPAGQVPELPLTTWNELWPLEDEPAALAAVSGWAAAERVPAKTVGEIASLVAPYLAAGGSLDDLLAGSRRKPPETPYRRIRRLLGVVGSMLSVHELSAGGRVRVLAGLDGCLAALG